MKRPPFCARRVRNDSGLSCGHQDTLLNLNVILDIDGTLVDSMELDSPRPYLKEFLHMCFSMCGHVSLWTAAGLERITFIYTTVLEPILDHLCQESKHNCRHREVSSRKACEFEFDVAWYENRCTRVRRMVSYNLAFNEPMKCKPLRKLFALKNRCYRKCNTIVVDDTPFMYCRNYGNALPICSFDGSVDDMELVKAARAIELMSYLVAYSGLSIAYLEKRDLNSLITKLVDLLASSHSIQTNKKISEIHTITTTTSGSRMDPEWKDEKPGPKLVFLDFDNTLTTNLKWPNKDTDTNPCSLDDWGGETRLQMLTAKLLTINERGWLIYILSNNWHMYIHQSFQKWMPNVSITRIIDRSQIREMNMQKAEHIKQLLNEHHSCGSHVVFVDDDKHNLKPAFLLGIKTFQCPDTGMTEDIFDQLIHYLDHC